MFETALARDADVKWHIGATTQWRKAAVNVAAHIPKTRQSEIK